MIIILVTIAKIVQTWMLDLNVNAKQDTLGMIGTETNLRFHA